MLRNHVYTHINLQWSDPIPVSCMILWWILFISDTMSSGMPSLNSPSSLVTPPSITSTHSQHTPTRAFGDRRWGDEAEETGKRERNGIVMHSIFLHLFLSSFTNLSFTSFSLQIHPQMGVRFCILCRSIGARRDKSTIHNTLTIVGLWNSEALYLPALISI